MRYSVYTALVLATVTIGNVIAGPVNHGHAHLHAKKNAEALEVEATTEEKRDPNHAWKGVDFKTVSITYSSGQTWGQPTQQPAPPASSSSSPAVATTTPTPNSETPKSQHATEILTPADRQKLITLGFKSAGANGQDSSAGVWIGAGGPYTVDVTNNAKEPVIFVCWGPAASWINANVPTITISLAKGASQILSFANGQSGACSAIYSDTQIVNGQVSDTWFEFTFSNEGVVDISREVNMNGHSMCAVGPECTTNMTTCVFVCNSGNSCMTNYLLQNCASGSQPGAQYGEYYGAASGGCGGLGSSASIALALS